jgi:outer membrane immunogenic protein
VIKRVGLATIGLLAVNGFAVAADFPAESMEPAPRYAAAPPVPYYDWSGFYIGGNFGGAWTNASNTITNAPTGAFVSAGNTNTAGVIGGGQVGFNLFFTPSFLVGVEADFDGMSNKDSAVSLDGATQHDFRVKSLATARGRLGFTADRVLFYGTGGFAWSQADVTRTQLSGTVNAAVAGTASAVETVSNHRTGWTAGAGVEYAFAPNWIARVEYLFARMGSITYTFPNAQRTTATAYDNINVLRAGVSYKFNWGGPIGPMY